MRLRQPRLVLGVLFTTTFVAAASYAPLAQQPEVQVVAQAAGGSVHMLVGRGGNIGVSVGADGVLMIDDQFADLAPKIQSAIDGLSKSKQAPKFVINTHFHGDHTGSNALFGRTGTILAHDNVRKRLASPKDGATVEPSALPVVTYADSVSLHFNGEEVRVMHFPGCHTDGDSVVLFTQSNVAHLGDLFFHQRFPFIDHQSGGSVRGLESAIGELLAMLPEKVAIIPGHGPLATLEDLKGYRAMLIECLALVGQAVSAGKTAQQIVDEKLLAKYESLSWQFISTAKWVETLVAESQAGAPK